jgi:hypothetical protein
LGARPIGGYDSNVAVRDIHCKEYVENLFFVLGPNEITGQVFVVGIAFDNFSLSETI